MWKLTKLSLLALIILLIGFRIFHKEDILFRIYSAKNRSIYSLLGFLPPHLKDDFVKKPVESNSLGTLYSVVNKYQSGKYLVYDNPAGEDFLVAYPPSLIYRSKELKNLQYEDYVSYIVNIEVFNRYLEDFRIKDKELIKKKYFTLIARGGTDYYVIQDTSDLSRIRRQFTRFSNNKLTIADLDPAIIADNETADYCWYLDKGVVQSYFHFEGNRVAKVDSKIIGCLGNEFISVY